MLRAIGNIIWLVLGGLEAAFAWAVAGLILFLPIVTIPLGIQALKIARYTAWPFGSRLVSGVGSPLHGVLAVIGNILWLPFGIIISLVHLLAAVLTAITIIGLPFAWAHLKLAGVSLIPFGFRVVDASEVPDRGSEAQTIQPIG